MNQLALTPVSLITGFLGSGKTTLLSRLLRLPDLEDAAVIVNEFGEVGLDHHLIESSDDNVVLLSNGCLCCTVRTDLVRTLQDLYERRAEGKIPPFRRVLTESTGLADPVPTLHTLMNDSFVRHRFRLDGVLTTVDALYGAGQLLQHPESVKQAAVADRIVLTKTDLVEEAAIQACIDAIRIVNPGAPIIRAIKGEIDPEHLFNIGLFNPAAKAAEVTTWLNAEAYADHHHSHDHSIDHYGQGADRHDRAISAHCFIYDCPLDWRYFSPNLASLVSRHAEKLLRVKGILNVEGESRPIVVHGVQHQFSRMRLESWPSEDRRSKLVVIVRDLDPSILRHHLQSNELAGS